MKYTYSILTFGLSLAASATGSSCVGCSSEIRVIGGPRSRSLGQLDDGQNRVGPGYGQVVFCFANATITDSSGRGCRLAGEPQQFECTENATPIPGFTFSTDGLIEYNGSPKFYECLVNDDDVSNIYTVPGGTKCSEVTLSVVNKDCHVGLASPPPVTISSVSLTSIKTETVHKTVTIYEPALTIIQEPLPTTMYKVTTTTIHEYITTTVHEPITIDHTHTLVITTACSEPIFSILPISTGTEEMFSILPISTSTEPVFSILPIVTSTSRTLSKASAISTATGVAATGGQPNSPPSKVSAIGTATAFRTVTGLATTAIESNPMPSKVTAIGTATGFQPYQSATKGTPTESPIPVQTCPISLSGKYEFPHLIIPINSAVPHGAYGTQYFGEVSQTVSSIFNFDIPWDYAGKSCSLIFLLPQLWNLETSSYTTSGTGDIIVEELSGVATQQTTYENAPKPVIDLGSFHISPGSSTFIATTECKAGQAVSYKLSATGDYRLWYFQDYNPSPIGLYVTVC